MGIEGRERARALPRDATREKKRYRRRLRSYRGEVRPWDDRAAEQRRENPWDHVDPFLRLRIPHSPPRTPSLSPGYLYVFMHVSSAAWERDKDGLSFIRLLLLLLQPSSYLVAAAVRVGFV